LESKEEELTARERGERMLSTKERILERLKNNKLLQIPSLFPSGSRGTHDLSSDHPTSKLDPFVVKETVRGLEQGQTHYVDVAGLPALREAVAAWLKDLGLETCSSDDVVITAGVQEARFLSLQVLGNSQGPIGVPEVCHPGVRKALGVRQTQVRWLPVEKDTLIPALQSVEQALTERCKLLYLELPSRFTGIMPKPSAFCELIGMIKRYKASVIVDGGLVPWLEKAESANFREWSNILERTVVLGELWPGIGLENLSIGYMVTANREWRERIVALKQVKSICTSTPSQLAALAGSEVFLELYRERWRRLSGFKRQIIQLEPPQNMEFKGSDVVNLVTVKGENIIANLALGGFSGATGEIFGAANWVRLCNTYENELASALRHVGFGRK